MVKEVRLPVFVDEINFKPGDAISVWSNLRERHTGSGLLTQSNSISVLYDFLLFLSD